MNNKYDLGKLLYKLDSFVNQSQDEFITNTIYSNNSNIISNLKIGQSDDNKKNILLNQDINEKTLKPNDATLYTPLLNIGKELKLNNKSLTDITNEEIIEKDPNKIIATKSYVDSHSGSIDLSNYDKLVKITNEDNELTSKKIILNQKDIIDISKKDNDESDNNKTIPTLSKVNDLLLNIHSISLLINTEYNDEIF